LIGPDQHRFNRDLADECRSLAASDGAGRRWSARHYLGGYTSYGSLDRLHLVSGLFARLRRRIDPHIKTFARALHYDLAGRTLRMTDCWANVMPAGVVHSLHLHPTSFISGTYYVAVPRGAGALKFEDPTRLRAFGRSSVCPPRRAISCCSRAGCATKCRRSASPASVSRLASTTRGTPRAPLGTIADGTSMRPLLALLGLLLALLAGVTPAMADCPLDLGRGTGWVVFSDHYIIRPSWWPSKPRCRNRSGP
jgi:uncharacterized protein (TIGR02466 family)